MHVLPGIAVSPGIAVGEALIIDSERFRIPRRLVARDAVEAEWQRFQNAVRDLSGELEADRDGIARELGAQCGAIFSAHLDMLHDPRLQAEIGGLVRDKMYSPEYAVSKTLARYAKVFRSLPGGHLAERAHDIYDIEQGLLGKLLGQGREELQQLTTPVVVLAHNLTPRDTARLDKRFVLGFATEIGGPGGHTAIIAQGMEIPAVVGLGRFLSDLSGGEQVIVDADRGQVVLQPDEETIIRRQAQRASHDSFSQSLQGLRDLPAETRDGARVQLLANIEFPTETQACLRRGADGIGLYRTEFLYLALDREPSEDDHFEAYRTVLQELDGRPVVIRTFDLGADKWGSVPQRETNPFLGLRSIRLSLRNLPVFRTQLRAILRASVWGNVRVMFPLIASLSELRQAKMVLAAVREDLQEEGIPCRDDLPVGMMVEVPSAAIMLDRFLPEVDFLSIGTNDLIQYTLAVDRGNAEVADRYQACEPAVLRLLQTSLATAAAVGVPVSVCGQMSGEPRYCMLLLGLGLRALSVPSAALPEIKQVCRSVTIAHCEDVARRAVTLDSAREIEVFLREELRKVVPELAAS